MLQGLQDAFDREQVANAEALPPTITHMKSGAQVGHPMDPFLFLARRHVCQQPIPPSIHQRLDAFFCKTVARW